MKASQNIPIIFLMLLLGFQLQVNAQGAGGVSSFTIEVTEEMLAFVDGGNRGFDVDFEYNTNEQHHIEGSNVSVSMQINQGNESVNSQSALEVQLSSTDSSAMMAFLNDQLAQAKPGEDGMRRVVLEYN